jgi:hypothetical protein
VSAEGIQPVEGLQDEGDGRLERGDAHGLWYG